MKDTQQEILAQLDDAQRRQYKKLNARLRKARERAARIAHGKRTTEHWERVERAQEALEIASRRLDDFISSASQNGEVA